MDEINRKLLIVVSKKKHVGLLSIGDIQRALIKNASLKDEISRIMRIDYVVARPNQPLEDVKNFILKVHSEFLPVVDQNNNILNVYFWEDLFGETKQKPLYNFNLPVVIMAGGFGSRLKPLTNVIPKPLIPIKDKTFIKEIFERFNEHGCDTFYISVNYKAELIKYYLQEQHLPYSLNYFKEEKPMGTAESFTIEREN